VLGIAVDKLEKPYAQRFRALAALCTSGSAVTHTSS